MNEAPMNDGLVSDVLAKFVRTSANGSPPVPKNTP